jgi:HEAT repeat protein
VTGKHWLSITLVAAATAALPPLRTLAQDATAAAAADLARRELEQLRIALLDPADAHPVRERDEAARRLLERGATDALYDALRSGRSEVQASAARAIAEAKNPPPEFVDLLGLSLTPRIDPQLADAASKALVNYRDAPAARARLRDFIQAANVPPRLRVPAIRALGTLTDKETARFLVETVLNGDLGPGLEDAAADALAEMTGLTEYGRDVGQWNRWWRDQRGKSDQQFLAERRADREGSARQAAERLKAAAEGIARYVQDAHIRITNPKDREADTLATLNNPVPEFRTAGARLVTVDLQNGQPGIAVKERLRDLIGDSSPDVRREAAAAIAAVNDSEAAPALLAQLRRERLEPVRAALMKALAPTKQVAAVPVLLDMLNEPAFQVSTAAAETLRELGPEIAKNRDLTQTVARALAAVIDRTVGVRGADKLRELATDAMVPLKDVGLMQTQFGLLEDRAGNSPATRGNAVRALAALNVPDNRKPDIAIRIAPLLQDPDKGVRLEAARALGTVGGQVQAQALYAASGPGERDDAVREAAWKSLSGLFEQFDVQALTTWAYQNFQTAPERKLVAFLALNKKLVPLGAPYAAERAAAQQEIGTLYLNPPIEKPDEALPYLQGAITYYDAAPGSALVSERLQESILNAYLHAKKYKEGVQFATGRIKRNAQNADTMGRVILGEVTRLERVKQYDDALALLAEAMNSGIGGTYRERFVELDRDIRGRQLQFFDRFREGWIGSIA